jgi:LytS/YehU family sensor histidine kinase
VPPFSFQPLVENAVEHGLGSSLQAGRLRLVVGATGPWLEMSVSDDGQGVPSTEVEQLFFAERQPVHALTLLRRRLKTLFGRSYQLEVRSEIGEGTMVAMRIPLQARFEVMARSLETGGQDTGQMAPNNLEFELT